MAVGCDAALWDAGPVGAFKRAWRTQITNLSIKVVFVNRAVLIGVAAAFFGGGAGAQVDKPLVAVSDFVEQGVSRTEAGVISERFRAALQRAGAVRQIERGQMEVILNEQGFQQSGCTSDACAVEIGQILGVREIVVGSVGVAGSFTVLSARVLDVATGEVLVTEEFQTRGGIDDLMERGVSDLARRLSAALTGQELEESTALAASAPDDQDASAQTAVTAEKRTRRAGPVIAVLGVAVAGGVTAAVMVGKRSDDSDDKNSTVRITLE